MKLDRFTKFTDGLAILQKYPGDKTLISEDNKILISGECLDVERMDAVNVGLLVLRGWVYHGDPVSSTPNWGFDAPARY